jgi:hypothetical protein
MGGQRTPGPVRGDLSAVVSGEAFVGLAKSFRPGPIGLKFQSKADELDSSPSQLKAKPGDEKDQAVEVNGPPPPGPIFLPPFKNKGPDQHPALPKECQAGVFFGVPPTQKTQGIRLSAAEVAKRRADIASAIKRATTDKPLSAKNLQHWLDGTGNLLKMPTAPFQHVDSRVPEFLADNARPAFEKGITERLKNAKHQQGSLLPSSTSKGATGPIRFLQHRDGIRPFITKPGIGGDLATALGAFLVHSALWVRATIKDKRGGFLGIGEDTIFEVEILRWCVQVYDSYDWNLASSTPIPIERKKLKDLLFPPDAVSVTNLGDIVVVTIKDQYFRDLEVSGGGKAYLVYTDPFPALKSVTVPFTITI